MIAILGVHDGHNSGATLLQDGEITFSISEERLTRIKNEIQQSEDSVIDVEIDKNEKRPSRRKRGFLIKEKELKETENNFESKDLDETSRDNTTNNNFLV